MTSSASTIQQTSQTSKTGESCSEIAAPMSIKPLPPPALSNSSCNSSNSSVTPVGTSIDPIAVLKRQVVTFFAWGGGGR